MVTALHATLTSNNDQDFSNTDQKILYSPPMECSACANEAQEGKSDLKAPSIAYFGALLKRLGIRDLIEKHIVEPRKQEGEYSLYTIVMTVLSNCCFLRGSQNSFHTTGRRLMKKNPK